MIGGAINITFMAPSGTLPPGAFHDFKLRSTTPARLWTVILGHGIIRTLPPRSQDVDGERRRLGDAGARARIQRQPVDFSTPGGGCRRRRRVLRRRVNSQARRVLRAGRRRSRRLARPWLWEREAPGARPDCPADVENLG